MQVLIHVVTFVFFLMTTLSNSIDLSKIKKIALPLILF